MTPDKLTKMKIMRMSGNTYAEIGARFGISRQRAHQIISNEVLINAPLKKKCNKIIESLQIVKKYQPSPVKVVIDDTIAFILSLMNEIETLEIEIESLRRSDTQ